MKSTKHHLKRVVGQQKLDFEEFMTIAAQVEACLNSRPLGAYTSHSSDGVTHSRTFPHRQTSSSLPRDPDQD